MTLEDFIKRFDGFVEKKPSEQILYFGYYLVSILGKESFISHEIDDCFSQLHIPAYSNTSSFLSRAKDKKRILKIKSGGYVLSRKESDAISAEMKLIVDLVPSNSLFPIELFDNTRGYLKSTARQAILCYDNQMYDACLVMIRRLIETLIIEIFELHRIQDRIKDKKGYYMFCGDLIDELMAEHDLWTIGRNTVSSLPLIKSLGDQCAHNRRFNAKRSDIDEIKIGLRTALEELIHIADFENARKRKASTTD